MSSLTKIGQLTVDVDRIRAFSEKHALSEFSIFGSALRDDFRPNSDVDVLFELIEGESMTIEKYLELENELKEIFDREIDVVRKRNVRNPFRRHEILTTRKKLYVRPEA